MKTSCIFSIVVLQLFAGAFADYPYCIDVYNPKYSCPKLRDGSWAPDGNWPDPNPAVNGCSNQFFMCVSGLSRCHNCQGDLVYNEKNDQCNYYYEVAACGGRPPNYNNKTTTSSSGIITSSTTIASPTSSTTIASPTSSTTTSTTTTTTKPPVAGPSICQSPNGFFPLPGYCGGNYYICVSDIPYPAVCPNGNYFDPNLLHCVPPGQVTCAPFECPDCNGNYPVPGACSSNFYICIENQAILQTCPAASIFDPLLKICVLQSNASCKVCK